MNLKAIFWVWGVTLTATGLVLGFRHAARAGGVHFQVASAARPDARRARHASLSDDPFSPDAFRDELLK
ncbi:MAG: hypothetical protein PHQ12_12555 [Chthoniobacteraceae bacterium]|nr:hypothetical protein [Chthoniobacteraceae bacterium]